MIAANGVAVAMVDFRNAIAPSSVPEVAPFPAGLNDCVSGLKWVHANSAKLNIDPTRIIVAGESGGGNLTLATGLKLKRDGDLGLIKGLYALCPYIAGEWPQPQYPSSIENNGILIDLHNNRGAMGYGIEAFHDRNPLAWPAFATAEDVAGLPPTVISVNECDPLRDEGISFYRLLMHNGVRARCRGGAVEAGADALTVANTYPAMAIDFRSGRSRLGNPTGGLSGPAIKPITLKLVWDIRKAVEIPVIGLGGIEKVDDVLDYLCVGASAVQVGTASFADPTATRRLVDGLEEAVSKANVLTIKEIVTNFSAEIG